MKKQLYILLSMVVALLVGACSKDDEVPGGEKPAPEKEWIMIDDLVLIYYANGTVATPMTPPCQVFDIKFPDGYVVSATVDVQVQLFKGSRYLLNYYNTKRIVSVAGGDIYFYGKDGAPATETEAGWDVGEGTMRYVPASILPQEPGSFDFYMEIDCSTEVRPYAFRSKVYRLVVSKIEGGWNIDSFGLAPGQEE